LAYIFVDDQMKLSFPQKQREKFCPKAYNPGKNTVPKFRTKFFQSKFSRAEFSPPR
jgi:hypothetical protein